MLERLRFGRTNLVVSRVAFGGIPIQRLSREDGIRLVRETLALGVNFIDTAHGYGHSEELIGAAIRGVPRESLVIATKSTASDRRTFTADLEESLRRLGTEYVDIFQFHGINSKEKMATLMGPGGAMEGMAEGVRAGRIRFPAFSSHSLRVAAEVIRTGRFDVVQVPFNFVDTDAATEVIPLARQADMGVIAMKPLGGGLLEDARLCFRYLAQFDGIVPDPGIESVREIREILGALETRGPLTEAESRQMDEYRRRLGGEWCHRCDYCQPCRQHINISTVLAARSFARRMPMDKARAFVEAPIKAAESCEECRECVERCPYHLDIPVLLKKQRALWDGYLKSGTWG
jgi:predicted aldo/keto reductase-like oxidoreductase